MNQKSCYHPIEHTGDLGVEVQGGSLEELLQNASWALVDTIADASTIQPKTVVQWEFSGNSPEEMLVHQLEEILYQLDAKGLIFSSFLINFNEDSIGICQAKGEPFSRESHGFKTEIKAITYHHLKVLKEEGGFRATVIFDV